jgi:hypothetical protein
MVRLLWAVREISGNHELQMDDLFDLEPGNVANWID